jgi:hypothetical protein
MSAIDRSRKDSEFTKVGVVGAIRVMRTTGAMARRCGEIEAERIV